MTLKRFVDKTGDFRSASDFVSIMKKRNCFLGRSVIIFNHFNELARKIKVKRHSKNLNVSHKKTTAEVKLR